MNNLFKKISLIFPLLLTNMLSADEIASNLKPALPDSIKAELILSYPSEADKDFTLEDALKICRDYQQLYSATYFYVMCKVHSDELIEKEFALNEHEEWTFMGLEVTESRDHWGYYRRTESPIFKKDKFKKLELDKIIKRKVLKVAVWGVGNLNEEKFKVVYPRNEDPAALDTLSFISRADAWLSCLDILKEKKADQGQSLRFDRARCKLSSKNENGRYQFKIISQNPFL